MVVIFLLRTFYRTYCHLSLKEKNSRTILDLSDWPFHAGFELLWSESFRSFVNVIVLQLAFREWGKWKHCGSDTLIVCGIVRGHIIKLLNWRTLGSMWARVCTGTIRFSFISFKQMSSHHFLQMQKAYRSLTTLMRQGYSVTDRMWLISDMFCCTVL